MRCDDSWDEHRWYPLSNGANLFQAVSLALGELLGGLPAGAPAVPRMAPTRVRRQNARAQ
jgi:hypothetical protein